MASRRQASSEKTLSEAQGGAPADLISDTSPAVSAGVIYKLLGFTLAMAALPIGSYFATVNLVFGGNSTYAGGFAAIMANVVLAAYILVAMREDQSDRLEAEREKKKWQ